MRASLLCPTPRMWILLISLCSVCTAQLMVQAEHTVVVLPEAGKQLYPFAPLACYVQPQVSNVRWITSDGTNVLSIQRSGQYFVSQGDIATISGEMKYGSILLIQNVSYKNAGVYVCEAMDEENCSDFPKFSIVQLVLKMTLEVLSSIVTVTYSSSEPQNVELQCEASGYIRPDSDIRWFKDDEKIIEGAKHSMTFREGRPNAAQTGLNETTSSRIAVLTIHRVDKADMGTYSCQSLETSEMASLRLNVEQESGLNPSITTPRSTNSPEIPIPSLPLDFQPPSTVNFKKDCSISIAAAVLCTFAVTATLTAVLTVIAAYMLKGGHSRGIVKSGASSPDLGGNAHPTPSHTSVQGQVDVYRISTDETEEMGGERAHVHNASSSSSQ